MIAAIVTMLRSRSESSGRRQRAATGPCRYLSRAGATDAVLGTVGSPALAVVIIRSSVCADNTGTAAERQSPRAIGNHRRHAALGSAIRTLFMTESPFPKPGGLLKAMMYPLAPCSIRAYNVHGLMNAAHQCIAATSTIS